MKFWAQLEERELDLEVRVNGSHLDVEVGGSPIGADFVPLPDGEVYSLTIEGRVHEITVEETGGVCWVTLHGRRFPVLVRHPLEKTLREVRRHAPAARGEEVASPIPGLVVAIKVGVGQTVAAGAPVAVVEAMKMQNELVTHGPGLVRAVHVRERQTVEAGQPLVSLDPVPA